MSGPWILVVALALGLGLAHSYLGERYILRRLFRRGPLPELFGSDWFTRRTLRFAWHLMTLAYWGLVATAVVVARAGEDAAAMRDGVLAVVAVTFIGSGVVAFGATRGRHLSWIVFLAIAGLVWWGRG